MSAMVVDYMYIGNMYIIADCYMSTILVVHVHVCNAMVVDYMYTGNMYIITDCYMSTILVVHVCNALVVKYYE